MLFEVMADANNWTQTGTGPQAVSANARHMKGSNFAFADGHIKWIKPGGVTAKKPDGKVFTFAVR